MKSMLLDQREVKGLLDGTITLLRRPVMPQPRLVYPSQRWVWPIPKVKIHRGCCESVCSASREWHEYLAKDQFPYRPGAICYGKETWQEIYETEYNNKDPKHPTPIREIILDFDSLPKTKAGTSRGYSCESMAARDKYYIYKASHPKKYLSDDFGELFWRPSVHMPREAARIFLLIKGVKVARVQDATQLDAWNEGFRIGKSFPFEDHIPELKQMAIDLQLIPCWNSRYAKRGLGWDTNPWTFAYEVELADKPEGWR